MAAISASSGCSSPSDSPSTELDAAVPPASVCATDPRVVPYGSGLEKASKDGSVKVRFVDATPAPPSRGGNTFTIELVDASNKPIDGATIATKPYMPDHAHGSSVVPDTKPLSGGQYVISNLELFMPGVWEITFTIQPAGGSEQTVVFTLCIDG